MTKGCLILAAAWLIGTQSGFADTPSPVLLPVPDVRQSTEYSCGATALQAVLGYYGIDVREAVLMGKLHCVPKQGTRPESIERVARAYGLQAELRQHVTLADLQKELDLGRPVIVDAQAWRKKKELKLPWSDVWESGHYLVAIGMDADNLYVEDPSLLGSRGMIPRSQFVERWHDYETGRHGSRQNFHQAAIFFRGRKPAPPPRCVKVH